MQHPDAERVKAFDDINRLVTILGLASFGALTLISSYTPLPGAAHIAMLFMIAALIATNVAALIIKFRHPNQGLPRRYNIVVALVWTGVLIYHIWLNGSVMW